MHFLLSDEKTEDEIENLDQKNLEIKSKSLLSLVPSRKDDSDDKEEPQETKELITKGDMSQFLYWKYFKATNSYPLLASVAILFILSQSAWSGLDYWLGFW